LDDPKELFNEYRRGAVGAFAPVGARQKARSNQATLSDWLGAKGNLATTKDDPLPTTTANGPARTENPKQDKRAAEDPNNGAKRRELSGRLLWSGLGGGPVLCGMSVRECDRPESVHSQAE
jgi:hypothetical protein